MPYNEQDRPFIPSMSWVACLPAGAMLYQPNILYRRVKGSKLSSSGVAIYRYPEALAMQTVYKPSLSPSVPPGEPLRISLGVGNDLSSTWIN